MKYLLTIAISFYALIIFAQKTNYFSKVYNYNFDESGRFIDTCKTGDLIIGAKDYYADVLRMDQNGKVLWRKLHMGWILEEMKVYNDTIYYIANNLNTPTGKNHLLFHAMNINSDSIYSRYIGTDAYESNFNFVRADDGGFIFVGIRDVYPNPKLSKLVAFKIDKTGKIEWEKLLGKGMGLNSFELLDLQKLNNDQYLVTFIASDQDIDKNYVCRFNSKGKVAYTKNFFTDLHESGLKVTQVSNNRIFGMISMFSDTSGWNKTKFPTQMVFLDSNMNYISKGTKFYDYWASLLVSYKELKDGGFIACGVNENTDTSYQYTDGAWLARFDSKGIMKWQRVIIDWRNSKSQSVGLFSDMEVLANNDFVMVGHISKDPDRNIWVVRTDSLGCPFPNCKGKLQNLTYASTAEHTLQGELQEVKVFPNPSDGIIWVELLEQNVGEAIEVQILDTYGRLQSIRKINVDDTVFRLDISNLSAGTYILRITDKHGKTGVKRFVKI
jgi:hypothetical protein